MGGPVNNLAQGISKLIHPGKSLSDDFNAAARAGDTARKKETEVLAGGINPGEVSVAQRNRAGLAGGKAFMNALGESGPADPISIPVMDQEDITRARRRYAALNARSSGRSSTILTNQEPSSGKLGAG